MSNSQPLQVMKLVRTFGSRRALDGATFEMPAGECLGLLGPNGAGKTTLIRCIAGRLRPDAGEIRLFGELVTPGHSAVTRRLGVIPQTLAIYDALTARENLELFGRIARLTGAELSKQVAWALQWTGLEDRAAEPAARFSGGMQRRLNIACGVLHQPPVILLDEPTVGVDPQSRQRIWQMLQELRQLGTSILLTTHQLDEAQLVCDRIVIIDSGRTIAGGTFAELLDASVGRDRHVSLTVSGMPDPMPEGCTAVDGRTIRFAATDMARELTRRLQQLSAAGVTVTDVDIQRPTLQSVFLHYTGHELRENTAVTASPVQ